ncbi:NAD(P)/FAD-dependent oxidoreductase [Eionea flava]
MESINTDIVIIGGGLAGMSLALQVHNKLPKFNIVIIEKNTFPVPDTTAKVGESTVEIGSHYFTEVLDLKEHFQKNHLKKYGLRCFFGHANGDYSAHDELGVSELFGIPTYQIERGVLENHLYQLLTDKGVHFADGATPKSIDIGNKNHQVICQQNNKETLYKSRWIIDAAGRQSLLKNKLNLQKSSGHKGNAVFFRVEKTIVIDEWSNNFEWQQRVCEPGKRWLSTNHLMGAGYWIWIIPLGSGATSFGIVMDDKALTDSNIQSFDCTMKWLRKKHPRCADSLEGAKLLDFKVIQDYSYDCKQMFSNDGWALTGEAGAFADPFYSPGSDFIALGNTFITRLIEIDMQGGDTQLESILFQKFYNSFFENTLSLYKHQYGGFGDRRMMSVKLVWDYTYYWGILTLLFFNDSITDIELMHSLNPQLLKAQKLNKKMQALMNKRAQKRETLPAKGLFMDQFLVPCLKQLNNVLKTEATNIANTLESNVDLMEKVAPYLEEMLADESSIDISKEEMAILGRYREHVLA